MKLTNNFIPCCSPWLQVGGKEELDTWRERMAEYVPCLDRDTTGPDATATVLPRRPPDLAVEAHARQKTFLQRDVARCAGG
jgi:hypothetical protein